MGTQWAIEQAVTLLARSNPVQQEPSVVLRHAIAFDAYVSGAKRLVISVGDVTEQEGPPMPIPARIIGGKVQLTDTQKVTLSVAETDSKGNPASDQLTWASDNPSVVSVSPAADGLSAVCVAGTTGTANVTVSDPSSNDPATGQPIQAVEPFVVVGGQATSLVISAGSPEEQ